MQRLDAILDHVEADAAPRDVRDERGRGHARQEDETGQLGLVGRLGQVFARAACWAHWASEVAMPRPSSATATSTVAPRSTAETVSRMRDGLPAARRSSGESAP